MGQEAISLLAKLPGQSVLCVGDVMLDRYVYGTATRISPEAPVPVVHVRRQVLLPGGVGNVVKNLAEWGVRTAVVSVVGDDRDADTLAGFLAGDDRDGVSGVNGVEFLRDRTRPTIVKTRIIAGIQQVVRFDEEVTGPISAETESALLARIEAALPAAGAVAASDYGKGVMTPGLTAGLIALAHKRGIAVAIDPKGHDYAKYAGADIVKPNRKELGDAVGRAVVTDLEVAEAARGVMERHGILNLLVTLSEKGMLLFRNSDGGAAPLLFPSKAREVYDVTGAGDTVLAGVTAALAAGAGLELGARLATWAAGVVVGKVGTAVAGTEEIRLAAGEA